MSVENSKSPVPAPAAEQPVSAAKDEAPATTTSREPSPADAGEVAQKIASNASAEPSEKLAEGNHRPHPSSPHLYPGHKDRPLTHPASPAVADKTNDATGAMSDVEMTDAAAAPADSDNKTPAPAEQPAAETPAAATATGPTPSKSHAKRKSVGAADAKGKKLNKKASKARILHIDAQPGEHYFVKLKGFPQWPVVICDESMLPNSLLKSRPVTAKRSDGKYRDDYQDGAKKAADRTFPVMYLHTNEL